MNSDMKIRKGLFGFRKKDVVKYVEAVNAEKDMTIQSLRQRVAELEEDKEIKTEGIMDAMVADAIEQNKVLSAKVTELTVKLNEAYVALDASREQARKLEAEKDYAITTVAETEAELMRVKKLAEENAAVIAMQKNGIADIYSVDELLQEIRSYRMIAAALRENSRKLTESLSKQMDFADTCIDSLTSVKENKK